MKKEANIALPQGVTPEMIKAFKDKYGENKLRLLSIPKDDNGDEFLEAVARIPDRKTMSEFEKWIDKAPDKAKEILINACLLTHKDEVKADDDLFLAGFNVLAELLPIRKGIIKNL